MKLSNVVAALAAFALVAPAFAEEAKPAVAPAAAPVKEEKKVETVKTETKTETVKAEAKAEPKK